MWNRVGRRGKEKTGPPRGMLEVVDEGLLDDHSVETLEACDDYGVTADGAAQVTSPVNYARWAHRLAVEFKLEYGIMKRTHANRVVVQQVLHKRLAKKNTRLAHIKSVLPLAVELCFMKDQQDLMIDALMQRPEMVRRAQLSVANYWERENWPTFIARRVLPAQAADMLGRVYPGTFGKVPGFAA